MAVRTKEENKVFSLAERKPVEKPTTRPQKTKRSRAGGAKSRVAWQSVALVCLCLLLGTTSGLALYAFHLVGNLRSDTDVMMSRVESRMQRLDAAVQFDSKRQRMLLNIRDAIMEANPRIGLSDAYQYSVAWNPGR